MKVFTALMFATVLLAADSGQNLFQKGLVKERTQADFRGAIKLYEQVVKEHSGDRKLAAEALFRIGECQKALGSPEARVAYERVVREFSDQSESAAEARKRLAVLGRPQQAGPTARQVWRGEPGFDLSLPSPDGRYACYTDFETGDLYVGDLVAGSSRRLTSTGSRHTGRGEYGMGCAISADSRQAAYWWFPGSTRGEIRTVLLSGGTPRPIPNFSAYFSLPQGWTPDGKKVLIARNQEDGTSQLAFVTVQDGSLQVLKSVAYGNVRASLSPDGRFIAYHHTPDGKTQDRDIFILAADGSGETPAVQWPSDDVTPVWTPDGSSIIFSSNRTGARSLWSLAIKDGKPSGAPELLKANTGINFLLAISPAGTLYYANPATDRFNIYQADLGPDGKVSGEPRIAAEGFLNSNLGAALSPDGQHLAYFSARPENFNLVIRTLSSGVERVFPLVEGFSALFHLGGRPHWFPDGRSVLAVRRETESVGTGAAIASIFGLYRVDIQSGKTELLHHINQAEYTNIAISPDGKSIFHTEPRVENGEQKGQAPVRFDLVTMTDAEIQGPRIYAAAFSPDGKQLGYIGSTIGETFVATMPSGGGPGRVLFRGPEWDVRIYGTPAWTSDQRYLIFANGGFTDRTPSTLWRIPVGGGQLEPMGLSMSGRIVSPQLTSDGRRIFFSRLEKGPQELWVLENFLPSARVK